ncbi:MAG TPA: hypothetical protein ENO18_03515, partial [Caldithrix sp.]|nr:hypothetical protein [Caldithrix sp.]
MLKSEPDTPKKTKLTCLGLLVLNICLLYHPVISSVQNQDSLAVQSRDSVKSFLWQPKILPELNQFDPSNISQTLQLVVPEANQTLKYYDPKNVMPKNFWEMDYRSTSYYTPRIVSDRLAQMMDRLPPDSFVPLPAVVFIAAKLALHYTDIQFKIEIKAADYIIDDSLEIILFSLLQKSPQTTKELYRLKEINQSRSME